MRGWKRNIIIFSFHVDSLKVMLVCGSDLLQSFGIPGVWIPEQVKNCFCLILLFFTVGETWFTAKKKKKLYLFFLFHALKLWKPISTQSINCLSVPPGEYNLQGLWRGLHSQRRTGYWQDYNCWWDSEQTPGNQNFIASSSIFYYAFPLFVEKFFEFVRCRATMQIIVICFFGIYAIRSTKFLCNIL